MPTYTSSCLVLVPSGRVYDTGCEEALAELSRRGYPVWRARQTDPPPDVRDRMVGDALAAGFAEILLVNPDVVFEPDDLERLRGHGLPLVCGLYPLVSARAFACEFLPGTQSVTFGVLGRLIELAACGLGFSLIRRTVFDAIQGFHPANPGNPVAFFASDSTRSSGPVPAGDAAFCRRAQAAGFNVTADTSIRQWHVGPHRYGWEDVNGDRDRQDSFTWHLASQPEVTPSVHNPLREPAVPLRDDFPSIRLYVVSYPANAASLEPTLESIRASDWNEDPAVIMQPDDWPKSRESGSRNYQQAIEAAIADGCDFALFLEDDVRVCRHLRHNLLANPLVIRDQCDYLSLFMPDLVADPWERSEPHLGYRLAKQRYSGSNTLWERSRVWGAQGLLLSRRFIQAALSRWDRLREGQDTRVLAVCAEFQLPLWYTEPSLVEHAPLVSAFDTPLAYSPDFDPEFRLQLGTGFQPPEAIPGTLTDTEARLLWNTAKGLDVLELGTACGRSTVTLAQSARRVVSVSNTDQSEAKEWVRRYRLNDRVEFVKCDFTSLLPSTPFDLVYLDCSPDAERLSREIGTAVSNLKQHGLLAIHHYPDPATPQVRKVVDEHARRLRWRRISQCGFVGIMQI